jgi:transposase
VAYVYAPDRKSDRPVQHLKGFTGVLQVDGYAGYGALAETGTVQLAFCWAHWRRRFYEIAQAGNAPIASEALARIAEIYAIEADIRGQDAEARQAVRQRRTKPLVDPLKTWLEAQLTAVSRKSTIAEAIRYGLGRWDGLVLFLDEAGSRSIPTSSSVRSDRSPSIARMRSLPDPTVVASIGPSLRR